MSTAWNHEDIVGKRFDNHGHPFVVLREAGLKNGTYYVEIKFDSGYICIRAKGCVTQNLYIKDRFSPSVHGVGCLGYAKRTTENAKVFDCWRAMIARCYNPKNPSYKTYGALDVSVCDRWKRFDLFLEDIEKIDGYNKDLVYNGKLDLDKDIKSSNVKEYNVKNCCWIEHNENVRESSNRRWNNTK